jgi:hypothetical protein
MIPSEAAVNEPDDAGIEYDLAGNPLPPKPKAAAAPPPGLHFAAPPSAAPFPGAPSPGGYPPGGAPAFGRPPAPVKSSPGPGLFFALGGGLLALTLVIFGLKALWPKPAVVPTSYKTYTAIDNSFSCDQPAGWSLRETGATNGNLATAVFDSGPARVRVISDATGSVMGDIAGAGNANLPPAQQVPAVQKIHMMDEKQLAASLPGYDEGDAQPIQSASGDARVSEWTAGGSLRGYRVTMLGREREFTVICFCPERDWPALRPAFQRIIGSVKPGSPS